MFPAFPMWSGLQVACMSIYLLRIAGKMIQDLDEAFCSLYELSNYFLLGFPCWYIFEFTMSIYSYTSISNVSVEVWQLSVHKFYYYFLEICISEIVKVLFLWSSINITVYDLVFYQLVWVMVWYLIIINCYVLLLC